MGASATAEVIANSDSDKRQSEASTVDAIVDAAQDLVQARGYNAFSYRDLSARVGIKTSSIHYHFPTKGDLVEALVARYRLRFGAGLSAIHEQATEPAQRLDLYLKMVCASFTSSNMICLCGMLATDAASLPSGAREQVRGFFGDNEAWLSPILESGRQSGEFSFSGDSADVAASLFATMQGAMISAYTFGEPARVSHAARHLQEMLRA